jgi:hypothetical protein
MARDRNTFNRWFIGAVAVGCLLAAGALAVVQPDEPFWWGGLLRAGVVCVALWACLPTRTRAAAWADFKPLPTALLLGAASLAVLRPKVGLPLLLLVVFVRWLSSLRRPRASSESRRAPRGLFD